MHYIFSILALALLVSAFVFQRRAASPLFVIALGIGALLLSGLSFIKPPAPHHKHLFDFEVCVGKVVAERADQLFPPGKLIVLVLPPLKGEGLDLSHQRLIGLKQVFADQDREFLLAGPDPFGLGSTDARFHVLGDPDSVTAQANAYAEEQQAVGIVSLLGTFPSSKAMGVSGVPWTGVYANLPEAPPRKAIAEGRITCLLSENLLEASSTSLSDEQPADSSGCENMVLQRYEWL